MAVNPRPWYAESMTNSDLPVAPDSPLDIADSILPAFVDADDKKRKYLAYRLCGFSRQEACDYVVLAPRTIRNWVNKDPNFKLIEETNLLTLRHQFSKQITLFEFTRNFKLSLDNDFDILDKFKRGGMDDLTKAEREYFLKMRGMYTPQQFSVLEELFAGRAKPEDFDWEMIVRGKGDIPTSAPKALT